MLPLRWERIDIVALTPRVEKTKTGGMSPGWMFPLRDRIEAILRDQRQELQRSASRSLLTPVKRTPTVDRTPSGRPVWGGHVRWRLALRPMRRAGGRAPSAEERRQPRALYTPGSGRGVGVRTAEPHPRARCEPCARKVARAFRSFPRPAIGSAELHRLCAARPGRPQATQDRNIVTHVSGL